MSEETCSLNPRQASKDRLHRKIREFKSAAYLFFHGCFWNTLYFFKVGRIYGRLLCRLNLYRKFHDGRCMWCGEVK